MRIKKGKKTHLVFAACRDFFGGANPPYKKLAYSILGRNVELSDQEKEDVWYIKQNLKDPIYRGELQKLRGV